MARPFRLLLIEDDQQRIDTFSAWVPEGAILTVAKSGGQAMGLLKRVRKGEYAGLMMDHDLRDQMIAVSDVFLSGSDMIEIIVQNFDRDVAVLVHSQNPGGGTSMAQRLDKAGFWVTRIPMHKLTGEIFCEWVDDVRDLWLDRG